MIDDFRRRAGAPVPELCFLSHMHEDHTLGLQRKLYNGPQIYCSAATKEMVLNFRTNYGNGPLKYSHLRPEIGGRDLLKVLDIDKPYQISYQGDFIQVTFIETSHCPGAVMILIQPRFIGQAVLFTGDIRCEPVELTRLRRTPTLFPFLREFGSSEVTLYVDSTYIQHELPLKPYPPNAEGVAQIVDLLLKYPPQVQFCIADQCTGHEQVLIALAEALNTRVHMDAYMLDYYSSAARHSALATELVQHSTTDLGGSRIHFCHKLNKCPFRELTAPTAYFKACNQPTTEMISAQNTILSFSDVGNCLEHMERNIYRGETQRYFVHDGYCYPLFPFYYFSRHASFPEIREFAHQFNVVHVKALDGTLLRVENGTDIGQDPNQVRLGLSKRFHTSPDGSTLGSEDERARYEAFCLLNHAARPSCRRGSDVTATKAYPAGSYVKTAMGTASFVPGNLSATAASGEVAANEFCEAHTAHGGLSEGTATHASCCQTAGLSFVDETPDACSIVRMLEQRLREDPRLWFGMAFDYQRVL